jgi:hypothetical protein
MVNRKFQLVEKLLSELDESVRQDTNDAMKTWWMNIRRDGGYRLTDHGYYIFKHQLGLQSWGFGLTDPKTILTKKIILDLDRKLCWPYYIDGKNKKIVFFSSREAMMATLHGDIANWLASLN